MPIFLSLLITIVILCKTIEIAGFQSPSSGPSQFLPRNTKTESLDIHGSDEESNGIRKIKKVATSFAVGAGFFLTPLISNAADSSLKTTLNQYQTTLDTKESVANKAIPSKVVKTATSTKPTTTSTTTTSTNNNNNNNNKEKPTKTAEELALDNAIATRKQRKERFLVLTNQVKQSKETIKTFTKDMKKLKTSVDSIEEKLHKKGLDEDIRKVLESDRIDTNGEIISLKSKIKILENSIDREENEMRR
jgi:hypothetical protein